MRSDRTSGRTSRGLAPPAAAVAVLLAVVVTACAERTPTEPALDTPLPDFRADATLLECRVDVRAAEVRCAPPAPTLPAGANGDVIVGGQDHYVKLSSYGTAYDSGTGIFSTSVQVQNLTRHTMGTPDGVAVEGVQVFFHSGPTTTSGSGEVTVANPDGLGVFTGADQPYYLWPEMLVPMQLSEAKAWQFAVDPGVVTFSFLVFVYAPLTDEESALLGSVWSGNGTSSDWFSDANWTGGALPDSAISATVPVADRIPGPQRPVLSADAAVLHLRVGTGVTLDLDGHALGVYGNLDAAGTIVDGVVRLRGAEALVGGALPHLESEAAAVVQRPTTVEGTLVVSGALTSDGVPLVISGP